MSIPPTTGDFTQMPRNWRLYGTAPSRRLIRFDSGDFAREWIYEDDGRPHSSPEFATKLAELQQFAQFARDEAILKAQEREAERVAARENDDREDGRRRAEARRAAEEIASASSTEHTTEFWVRIPGQPKNEQFGPIDTSVDACLLVSVVRTLTQNNQWEAYVVETTVEERLI